MKMKLKLVVMLGLTLTFLCTSCVFGNSEIVDGFSWDFTIAGEEATDVKPTNKADVTGEFVNLTVPSKLDGKPVKSIANEAFYKYGNLESIIIPSSVTSIGENAFFLCKNLYNIVLSEGSKKKL